MRAFASSLALIAGACAASGSAPVLPPAFTDSLREAIWNDAARTLAVSRDALQLMSVQAVTWSDAALGCPQPGRVYMQALVPGWRIELGARGQQPLLYHADRRSAWLQCPRQRAQAPSPTPPDRRQ